jgi:hypothetical protein
MRLPSRLNLRPLLAASFLLVLMPVAGRRSQDISPEERGRRLGLIQESVGSSVTELDMEHRSILYRRVNGKEVESPPLSLNGEDIGLK